MVAADEPVIVYQAEPVPDVHLVVADYRDSAPRQILLMQGEKVLASFTAEALAALGESARTVADVARQVPVTVWPDTGPAESIVDAEIVEETATGD